MNVPNTTAQGDLSELEVIIALTRSGKRLLRPLSAACRYDVAIDSGDGTLVRVQCKTGRLKNGRILFRVCSTDARRPHGTSYHGEVDAFGVYCPETRLVYLVPMTVITDCGTMSVLRVDPARNRQTKRIRHASDFEVRSAGVSERSEPHSSL